MKHLSYKSGFLFFLLLLTGCWKEPNYPKEPQITFNSIKTESIEDGGRKLRVTVALGFKDGNGDLGLAPVVNNEDAQPPYDFQEGRNKFFYNYFVEQFIEINGQFVPYDPTPAGSQPVNYNGRFLPLNENGKPKPLEGELRRNFDIPIDLLPLEFKSGDRMKFRIQIADRALNLSNTIETDPIQIIL